MTSNPTPIAIDNYFNCWNEPDDSRRLNLIEAAWADRARSVDPLADATGHVAISEMMGAVQQQFPDHRFQLVGEAAAHHHVLHWSWSMIDADGSKVIGGIDVARLDADGRIADLTGFFDNSPS